jgi:hypothetical protein
MIDLREKSVDLHLHMFAVGCGKNWNIDELCAGCHGFPSLITQTNFERFSFVSCFIIILALIVIK